MVKNIRSNVKGDMPLVSVKPRILRYGWVVGVGEEGKGLVLGRVEALGNDYDANPARSWNYRWPCG